MAVAEKQERREHPRSQRGFAPPQGTVSGKLIRHVDNISCSGVLCRVDKSLPLMEKLLVTIELPDRRSEESRFSLECEGVVVRSEPVECEQDGEEYQIAIFFTRLGEETRQRIADYVEWDLRDA